MTGDDRQRTSAAYTPWYDDRDARAFLLFGFLPWFLALSLAWESAHVPLYAIWRNATTGYIIFSVVHCSFGDVAIASTAIVLALTLTRSQGFARWNWCAIVPLAVLVGAGYTVFSEWINLSRQSWQYSELMPVVKAFGIEIGLSPLAQWLIVLPLALWLARRRPLRRAHSLLH